MVEQRQAATPPTFFLGSLPEQVYWQQVKEQQVKECQAATGEGTTSCDADSFGGAAVASLDLAGPQSCRATVPTALRRVQQQQVSLIALLVEK